MALGLELKKISNLNAIYLEPETYFRVLDTNDEAIVRLDDFRNDGTDVQLVADPSMANTEQKIAKADALMAMRENPAFNKDEIDKRWLEAYEFSNIDSLIVPPDKRPAPPPDPKLIELDMKAEKQAVELEELRAKIQQTLAKAIESIANAESKEAGDQLASYQLELDAISRSIEDGRNRGMEANAGNESGIQTAQGPTGGVPRGGPPVGFNG